MKPTPVLPWMIVFAMLLAACGSSDQPTEVPATPTLILPINNPMVTFDAPTIADAPTIMDTPAITESPAADVTEVIAVSDSSASCTILETLNLRSGPGTDYDPPVQILLANSIVTPLGYSFVSSPNDGPWTYIRDEVTQTEGWVSADAEYIDCNVDLTTLPAVIYHPPP